MLGALLSFLSAALFALNNNFTRRGVLTGSAGQALAITVPMGALLFIPVALFTGEFVAVFTSEAWVVAFFAIGGLCHFVWGRYCNYRASQAMGLNLVAPVQGSNVLVSLALAVTVLGETMTVLQIIGLILVLAGPTLLVVRRRGKKRSYRTASGFEPKLVEGYTFAILSALGYGASPIFVRAALNHSGLAFGGGMVSYVAAALFIAPVVLMPGKLVHIISVDRTAARWFAWSGLLVFISQVLRYVALLLAPVVIVAPIQRVSAVLRLLFAWFINREHEVFEPRVIVSIIVSLAGSVILALHVDLVARWLGLPPGWSSFLAWTWP